MGLMRLFVFGIVSGLLFPQAAYSYPQKKFCGEVYTVFTDHIIRIDGGRYRNSIVAPLNQAVDAQLPEEGAAKKRLCFLGRRYKWGHEGKPILFAYSIVEPDTQP